MNKNSYLGIDLGTKRVGLAYSNNPVLPVPSLGTINVRGSLTQTSKEVLEWLNKETQNQIQRTTFIVGNPINLEGQETKRSEISKSFCQKLQIEIEARGLKDIWDIILWDERLTSVESEQMINHREDFRIKGEDRKRMKDQLSASIILESYLRSIKQVSN